MPLADLPRRAARWLAGRRPPPASADEPPSPEHQLAALRPRVVPRALFAAGLPGPRADLVFPGLALSWGLLLGRRQFAHVTKAMVLRRDGAGIDRQRAALANLRPRHPRDAERRLFTGYYQNRDRTPGCAFALHDDGLGLSRLLLHDEIARVFPEGYRVALPDLQAGLVLSATAPPGLARAFADTVDAYYSGGAAPISAGLFDPALLRPRASAEPA